MSGLRLSALSGLTGLAALSGCMGDPLPAQSPDFSIASYPAWREEDEAYRFYPGDKFRMDIRTAPELSAELTIAPDGRITLPTIGPVMAGGQTVRQLQTTLENIYGNELRDPARVITPTGIGSQKVFGGGEGKQAGGLQIPGYTHVLQASLVDGARAT